MSYMEAQGLLKTLIATCPAFPAGSVSEGDFGVLDRGFRAVCVIVPGTLTAFDTVGMVRVRTYSAYAILIVRCLGDYNIFGTARDQLTSTIDASPCLSDTYSVTQIDGTEEPTQDEDFVRQRLSITLQEHV